MKNIPTGKTFDQRHGTRDEDTYRIIPDNYVLRRLPFCFGRDEFEHAQNVATTFNNIPSLPTSYSVWETSRYLRICRTKYSMRDWVPDRFPDHAKEQRPGA